MGVNLLSGSLSFSFCGWHAFFMSNFSIHGGKVSFFGIWTTFFEKFSVHCDGVCDVQAHNLYVVMNFYCCLRCFLSFAILTQYKRVCTFWIFFFYFLFFIIQSQCTAALVIVRFIHFSFKAFTIWIANRGENGVFKLKHALYIWRNKSKARMLVHNNEHKHISIISSHGTEWLNWTKYALILCLLILCVFLLKIFIIKRH